MEERGCVSIGRWENVFRIPVDLEIPGVDIALDDDIVVDHEVCIVEVLKLLAI
jgi:hypothetical protein